MAQNQSPKLDSGRDASVPPPIPNEMTMAAQINEARAKKSLADKSYREEVVNRTAVRSGQKMFADKGEQYGSYGGSTLGKVGRTVGKTLGGLVGRGVGAVANRQVNQELNQPLRSVPPPPPPPTATPDEGTQASAINLGQSKEKNKKNAVVDAAKDIEKDLVEKQVKKTIVRVLLNPGTWVAIFWIIVALAIAFLLSIGGLIVVADYQCLQQKGLGGKIVAGVKEYMDPGSLLRDWAAGKCAPDAPAPTADAPVKPETPATAPVVTGDPNPKSGAPQQ